MKNTFGFTIKDIAEIAILSAIAIIFDKLVKIPIGATGGSINLAMLPLYIIALRHGWFKSFISGGLVFGLLTCLLDGYGLICYPLEYLVAFGSVCILGIFANYITKHFQTKKEIFTSYLLLLISIIFATAIRIFSGTFDSILIYSYTFIPALIYNLTYIIPSSIIVAIILSILLPVIIKMNKTISTSYLTK